MSGSFGDFGARIVLNAKACAPRALSAIPVLVIPALEWVPVIPSEIRPWIILGSILLAAVGFAFTTRREKSVEKLEQECLALKELIKRAEPEQLLREVATTVFREGAWRLTIYKKAYSPDPTIGDHLVRLSCVASDGDQSLLGSAMIGIRSSTLFEQLFLSNLADSRFRHAEQSGGFPDDLQSISWEKWRVGIFGEPVSSAPDHSTFRARKYVWYAAQEPQTQSVFALVAESASEEGVVFENVDHVLTPAWLFFVSRLAEVWNGTTDGLG